MAASHNRDNQPLAQGLYLPEFERDACGVGFICQVRGRASHSIVDDALLMLENMNHRGACGCEKDSGDGAGIMVSMPDKFFRREANKWGFKLPKAGAKWILLRFTPLGMAQEVAIADVVLYGQEKAPAVVYPHYTTWSADASAWTCAASRFPIMPFRSST